MDPGIYRPISLLNEARKLFERVIVNRINQYLINSQLLSDYQYGFRAGRSTLDAIVRLREIVEAETQIGKVVVAIEINVANAFNSLPWRVIRKAMQDLQFSNYLCRIIHSYLQDRRLVYVDCINSVVDKQLSCGVPQGLVLGPTLWNVGYNQVLDTCLPGDCRVICYADNTVLLVASKDYSEATHSAMVAAYILIERIEELGLKLALQKTKVIVFPATVITGDTPRYIHIGAMTSKCQGV